MHDAEVSTWGSDFEGQFWALSDSIEDYRTPCKLFKALSRTEQAWIVQTTSPAADRWKRWRKECHAGLFIMKSFNERESKALRSVIAASVLPSLTYSHSTIFNYDVKAFLNFHRKWGGCALTCIDLVEGITSEGALQDKASKVAKNFAKDPGAITMEKSTDIASHYLFTLSPHEDDREISIFQVVTPYLRDLVMKEIARFDAAQQASFYFQASGHSHLQGALGYIFERYVYLWLFLDANAGEGLPCTAVQSGKGKSTTSKPDLLSLLPVGKDNVTVSSTSFFKDVNNKRAAPFAWIPDSRMQPTYDAIIFTHDHIITIQATVADNHSMNPKGFETMKALLSDDFQNTRKLCHVFITDRSTNVTGLQRHRYKVAEDMGISVHVAHLDTSMFSFTSDELERTSRVDVSKHKLQFDFGTNVGVIRTSSLRWTWTEWR